MTQEQLRAWALPLYQKGHISAAEFEQLCASEDFARQMAAFEYVMDRDREVLLELARC